MDLGSDDYLYPESVKNEGPASSASAASDNVVVQESTNSNIGSGEVVRNIYSILALYIPLPIFFFRYNHNLPLVASTTKISSPNLASYGLRTVA